MALLIAILTFVIATMAFLLAWLFFGTQKRQEIVRRRIEAVRKVDMRGAGIPPGMDLLRDEMLSSIPTVNRMLLRWSWPTELRAFLNQAGLQMKPAKLVLISGVAAFTTYLVMTHFVPPFPIGLFLAVGIGAVPIAIVAWMRNRRFRKFEEHFPEALDLLGRAVRAGHAFTTGLEMIAKESPEPISGEFRITFDEQNFGLPLRDALLNLTERMPLIDVRFFVTALLIQKETGGNLAEILDGLAHVIRDRFRLYREVGVKTAQGKLTALILIALPLFLFAALEVLNPSYVSVLFTDPRGPIWLTVVASLQVIGSILLWKIIHIEV
jgi:tight adherence protein B